jgi:hypothetical protein
MSHRRKEEYGKKLRRKEELREGRDRKRGFVVRWPT